MGKDRRVGKKGKRRMELCNGETWKEGSRNGELGGYGTERNERRGGGRRGISKDTAGPWQTYEGNTNKELKVPRERGQGYKGG